MEWIARYSDAINAMTSAGLLLVWLVYLQIFISSYHRQLRATLIIARGAGEGTNARCLLTNMSSEALYVSSVQVLLHADEDTAIKPVTDVQDAEEPTPERRNETKQGALKSSESRDIGSFDDLIRQAFGDSAIQPEAGCRITVEVVALYGPEDLPIGARRTFLLQDRLGALHVEGEKLKTDQLRSKRQRRKLLSDLDRDR